MLIPKNLLGTVVLSVFAATTSLPAADKPNIVYILSDNQSFYEMSCHGHAQIKTPHIDRLATQSIEFTRFYAPPYCSPSRAVILTGQHAMRSGVHDTIGGRSIMHRDQTTLPDILKEHGYHTGIFGKWHLGFSYPHRPQDRGFDEVFIHRGGGVGQMEDYYGNTHYDTTFIHNGKGGNGTWAVTVVADGRYRFECRHFPREADKAMGVTHAKIRIGDVVKEREIDAVAGAVRFELDLKAGDYDLQAWLSSGQESSGPLFLYVSAK